MTRTQGEYLGTFLAGTARPYREQGLFPAGRGEYWITEEFLYFERIRSEEPFRIPFVLVENVETGRTFGLRFLPTQRIVKLAWAIDNRFITSGFILAGTASETARIALDLRGRIRR